MKGLSNYRVDSEGNILSLIRNKIISQHKNRNGYCNSVLWNKGKPKNCLIHRLVAEAFVLDKKGEYVNHLNFIKDDNRSQNLEWVTPKQNSQHAIKHWRYPVGTKCSNAKLSEQDVLSIRTSGLSQRKLAITFGVCKSTIGKILQRKRWKHI